MKNQNFASCQGNFGIPKQKLLALYIAFITLLTQLCDGQTINTAMFEIPSKDQESYMLKDCRKMAADDIDCKCAYLGRKCQQADVKNCENCSCLDGSATSAKIFYIKKRYGAVCLSVNNLFNAAGFGKRFHFHNPVFSRCALAVTTLATTIQHSDCTSNDPRQVWLWTPGNLLMNAQTSTCLQTKKGTADYLPMTATECDSSDLGQKWRCDERLLFQLLGVSFSNDSKITHAARYLKGEQKLNARSVKKKVSEGNTWTVFPTNNQSVCSTSHNEGYFYLDNKNTEISQIDLVPMCPNDSCSKKLLTSTNTDNLLNCTILWDEDFSRDSEPFIVENREDGLYFKWKSNPYTRLKGTTLDMTIECVMNNSKFEEYLFRLRVKDINYKTVQEHHQIIQTNKGEQSNIRIIDLDKDCIRNRCLRKITAPSTLNKTQAVCVIQWKESTLLKLDDNTSVVTENITELLSLRKVEGTFNLEWKFTDAPSLANITFNLTILCHNDENENTTTVEKSSLVFQTRYGFIPESKSSDKNSADKTRLYLAITLPIIIVLLIVLVIVLILWSFRRKQRSMKESTSKHNLHSNVEHQCSNSSVDLQLNSNGVECKSEDNPVYEQCITTAHPAVTIARNKIYECTNNPIVRTDSDIYEKPLENIKVRQNKFYASVDPTKNSPKPKSHPAPKTSPKPSPNLAPKPGPKPEPVKKPPTPQHYKVPKVIHPPEEEQDVYDQPLGFIPSIKKNDDDEIGRDEIPLQGLEGKRIHSTYEKPLPDSPPCSGVYDYATWEELPSGSTRCQAEKPLESTKGTEHGGSVNSNGSLYDAPLYDVLERI